MIAKSSCYVKNNRKGAFVFSNYRFLRCYLTSIRKICIFSLTAVAFTMEWPLSEKKCRKPLRFMNPTQIIRRGKVIVIVHNEANSFQKSHTINFSTLMGKNSERENFLGDNKIVE